MKRWARGLALAGLVVLLGACVPITRSQAQQDAQPERIRDVVYGRKYGMLLGMDIFKPAKPSGIGVLWMVSGGWVSRHESIAPAFYKAYLDRGQTVFAVLHGSAPKYTVPEVLSDIDLATRFVRLHAAEYGVDPDRLGISGASAGGHLSLMQGATGRDGDPSAADPLAKQSSKVQAVACFFPPTDFVNYGETGKSAYDYAMLRPFWATLGAKSNSPEDRAENAKRISPITYATKSMPPTLIIHGDKDQLVPLQQAEVMIRRLQDLGVEAKLVTKEGGGHGWAGIQNDVAVLADWFDRHLKK